MYILNHTPYTIHHTACACGILYMDTSTEARALNFPVHMVEGPREERSSVRVLTPKECYKLQDFRCHLVVLELGLQLGLGAHVWCSVKVTVNLYATAMLPV